MSDKSEEALRTEEYKVCKQQILENIKAMDQLEIYSVGAIAGVFVFALSQSDKNIVVLAVMLACLIALLGFLRFWALDSTIGVLNDYVQGLEKQIEKIGWTTFYREKRTTFMSWSRWIVWCVLLFLTFSFQLIVLCKGPFWVAKG